MHILQPKRPLCKLCGVTPCKSRGKSKLGYKIWHTMCSSCSRKRYNNSYKHLSAKKSICEECNFVAKDPCQLDLIYLDNNTHNVSEDNLKTLCANCKRLYNKKMNESKSIMDITIDNDIDLKNLL
jgi:hypothetical protein